MSNSAREFNAASVEEALGKAAESLGVAVGDLEYEVIDAGSEGFLGIGARDARIRVAADRAQPPDSEFIQPQAPLGEEEAEVYPPEDRVERPTAAPYEEVGEHVLQDIEALVSSIVRAMGLDARVNVYDAGEFIAVDVASDHTALLIGQKGETIDALQHLVNSSIYRNRPFAKRIVLDSEGYRQRRIEALQGMAYRTSRRALREKRQIKLPPMNSSERRIIHLYLQKDQRISTFSEGSGTSRRVVVSPNKPSPH